jgi:hypothetical protein
MSSPESLPLKPVGLGVLGAVAGGVLGYLAFMWAARQGFYALVLPGAALGLGCGLAARSGPGLLSIACGIAGLGLGFFSEWKLAPFIADDSLGYFVTHLHELRPMTLILIALGGFFAWRLAMGFGTAPRRRPAAGDTANPPGTS